MPMMPKPKGAIWGNHPIVQALMRTGSQIGLDDPSAIMGVGGTLAIPRATSVVSGAAKGALGGLKALSEKFNPVAETLGEVDPYFTPVGGEALYNIGKGASKAVADPVYASYMKLLGKGGR